MRRLVLPDPEWQPGRMFEESDCMEILATRTSTIEITIATSDIRGALRDMTAGVLLCNDRCITENPEINIAYSTKTLYRCQKTWHHWKQCECGFSKHSEKHIP